MQLCCYKCEIFLSESINGTKGMIDTRYLPNKYTNMEPLHLKKKTKIPYLIGWQHHEASLFYIVDQSKANYKMVVELHSTLRHIQDKIK